MGNTEKFFVQNNDVQLEAEYFESRSDPSSTIIICHPHPQFLGI